MVRIPARKVLLVALVLMPLLTGGCAWITRASVNVDGADPNAPSLGSNSSISADGRYIAFDSDASDLVSNDGNETRDVFVRDTRTGTTTRVSVDVAEGDSDGGESTFPSISADGRYVAFESQASDLVPSDANSDRDIFVRDMQAGTTIRASVDAAGGDPNGQVFDPSISADGRFVAFTSYASDLVANDGNEMSDVFVRDVFTSTTARVSVDTTGGDANSQSQGAAISADGLHIAFSSAASDLVPGDEDLEGGLFIRNLQTGTTALVSTEPASPSVSADGRYVAFWTHSSEVVPNDNNGLPDVFVRDMHEATPTRISTDMAGSDANGYSVAYQHAAISGDGRFVVFESAASDLVPGDTTGGPTSGLRDIFVRDRKTATTTRVSVDGFGREASGGGGAISSDGRYVAFVSSAGNLVPEDTNGVYDVFVRATLQPDIALVTPATVTRGSTTTLSVAGSGFYAGVQASLQAFGPYGVRVDSVLVISETELQLSVTVDATAPPGPRNVMVWNPGTGPGPLATGFGFCLGCLTVT